ncbi:uncharacterized protein LOC120320683, partial [Drosophila yakuba]|uniref:uncharacterized protein LOC120320683 n=1 Tax=Drosophila yakuba TaxID=7245 RepID=UPI0019307F6F
SAWTGSAGHSSTQANLPRTQCQVPRYIASPFRDVQLHGFADASSHAYGAVVYPRVAVGCSFQVTLVAAKTRVAPIKPVSIPRLELNAALLLSRLLSIVKTSLKIPLFSTSCWTDSEIVLHWLSALPRRWNTYVCNRTSEILSDFPVAAGTMFARKTILLIVLPEDFIRQSFWSIDCGGKVRPGWPHPPLSGHLLQASSAYLQVSMSTPKNEP